MRNIIRAIKRLFPRQVYNYPPMPRGYAVLHLVDHGWKVWG